MIDNEVFGSLENLLNVGEVINSSEGFISDSWTKIKSFIKTVWEKIKAFFKWVWEKIKSLFGKKGKVSVAEGSDLANIAEHNPKVAEIVNVQGAGKESLSTSTEGAVAVIAGGIALFGVFAIISAFVQNRDQLEEPITVNFSIDLIKSAYDAFMKDEGQIQTLRDQACTQNKFELMREAGLIIDKHVATAKRIEEVEYTFRSYKELDDVVKTLLDLSKKIHELDDYTDKYLRNSLEMTNKLQSEVKNKENPNDEDKMKLRLASHGTSIDAAMSTFAHTLNKHLTENYFAFKSAAPEIFAKNQYARRPKK